MTEVEKKPALQLLREAAERVLEVPRHQFQGVSLAPPLDEPEGKVTVLKAEVVTVAEPAPEPEILNLELEKEPATEMNQTNAVTTVGHVTDQEPVSPKAEEVIVPQEDPSLVEPAEEPEEEVPTDLEDPKEEDEEEELFSEDERHKRLTELSYLCKLCTNMLLEPTEELKEVSLLIMKAACHAYGIWEPSILHFLDAQVGPEGIAFYLYNQENENDYQIAPSNSFSCGFIVINRSYRELQQQCEEIGQTIDQFLRQLEAISMHPARQKTADRISKKMVEELSDPFDNLMMGPLFPF